MEFIREDCIYARQSVDRKDSISIESQIDFCKYELKGGSCRVFKDKGYSGKNTDRPEFQKLLGEIRKGKVRRVIVYKLDRISRSILDFATMMELFQEYDVEFVSSTEKFDTSTPMGRAMLNICIVFAQLERETIQKRVTDAYYSRCLKGFHMSGQAPYGYQLEPTVVEGIRTKKMVADPIAADHVRLMFEMYAEPETSFGDITRYFEEHDIKIYGKSMFRTFLSQLLRNPVYAQADLELYEFFKSQGAAIVNDASDFAGTNGCYLYKGRDVKEDKDRCLKDQILVIAPHEALISSDTWLKCRKKLMANTTFQQGRKPKNTWLAGKIKCGHCGYALKATHVPNSTGYFRCTKRTENKGCPGCGKIRKEEFEQFIFSAMQEKFKDFQILHGREEKVNPKLTAYQVELAQVEAEIEKLLDKIRSTGRGGISADDDLAVEKLKKKLEGMESQQTMMKAVNAYYCKHKTLEDCPELTAEQVEKVKAAMSQDWRKDPVPFPSYLLTNNNANIRRVRQRIEELSHKAEFVGWTFPSGEAKANEAENRLQLIFAEKPDADTRQALKSEGFKWAPSQGAWQRQLNQNAIRAAARLDFLRPEDGKSPYQLQPFAKRAEKDVSR